MRARRMQLAIADARAGARAAAGPRRHPWPRRRDQLETSRERTRAATVVVRGRQRDWLAYIGEAVRLTCGADADALGADRRALAPDVRANHHRLLLGLPGGAAERTAAERAELEHMLDDRSAPNPERNGGA